VSTVEIYYGRRLPRQSRPGGWAALLSVDGREKEIAGAEALTTNNRMELTAVIRALESLRRPVSARVFTDSQYVRRGIYRMDRGVEGARLADGGPQAGQEPGPVAAPGRTCRRASDRVALGAGPRRRAGQ